MKQPKIRTHTESYVVHYPEFVKYARKQLEEFFWTPDEINIEKDKQDMLVNMTEAERHAVTTALKLFVKYELFVGTEYWLTRVLNKFPRPEIQRMASVFGMVELAVHAPFYNKLNEVLGLNTDEFYTSYVDDPILKERIDFLNEMVDSEDDLLSLAVFSMMEGAILFSSFALFKNFQSNGNNLIRNTVSGINQSVLDEALHAEAGAALFRKVLKESKLKSDELELLKNNIEVFSGMLLEHEERIIDMFFEKGDLRGVTKEQMKAFAASRVNHCLEQLGLDLNAIWEVNDFTVANWFYGGVEKYQQVDFFNTLGREYQRGWNEKGFEWKVSENV